MSVLRPPRLPQRPLKQQFDNRFRDCLANVSRLKDIPFETAIIEHCQRYESSVEEALIEMYLAGVSVRRVEDITQALWGEGRLGNYKSYSFCFVCVCNA